MSRGTNASGMRRYNERLILSAVRRLNGASKAELSRITALSPQAVVRIVDELEAEGLLFQAEKRKGGMGQPATIYRINGERGYPGGVEVGRSGLTLALLDFDGTLKAIERTAVAFPAVDAVLAEIDRFTKVHLTAVGKGGEAFLGVGIAMPWFLGEWREETGISEDQASEWRDPAVEARLREGIAWPVHFENDGNAATLAQSLCGAGLDLQDFLNINLGTFVGGGLVLGGLVVQGRHGNAGALASMPVCIDGRSDYLIHHASLYALPPEGNAGRDVWLARCCEALHFAIVGANSLLDLEAVVIDGALPAQMLGAIVEDLERRLRSDVPPDFFTPLVRPGNLGDTAAAMGAGLLPLHASFSPELAALVKGPAAKEG
ncbi:MAG: ROK family protein [Sphingopyxis sp.]|nr:ROK family protein [Sphingopyxis sp.]